MKKKMNNYKLVVGEAQIWHYMCILFPNLIKQQRLFVFHYFFGLCSWECPISWDLKSLVLLYFGLFVFIEVRMWKKTLTLKTTCGIYVFGLFKQHIDTSFQC